MAQIEFLFEGFVMNVEQIALLRKTWGMVVPVAGKAADIFYNRLFEIDPLPSPYSRAIQAIQRNREKNC